MDPADEVIVYTLHRSPGEYWVNFKVKVDTKEWRDDCGVGYALPGTLQTGGWIDPTAHTIEQRVSKVAVVGTPEVEPEFVTAEIYVVHQVRAK